MYNLNEFDAREELLSFEDDLFTFDTSEQYSLNEKDEKIWSYNVRVDQNTLPVIFQLMWFENKIHISYSTDHPDENVRIKASEMAHRIQEALLERVKVLIVLEAPIITDFHAYKHNCADIHNVKVHAEIVKSYIENLPITNNTTHLFELYGKDGFMLGEELRKALPADFVLKENMPHQLIIKQDLSKQERQAVMELIQLFGYAITYEEIETYNKQSVIDLFNSGLIQMETAKEKN